MVYDSTGLGVIGGIDWDGLDSILIREGHQTEMLGYLPLLYEYDILYIFFAESLISREVTEVQEHVYSGGRAILCGEWGPGIYNDYLNAVLSDPVWDEHLGGIRSFNDYVVEFPTFYFRLDSLDSIPCERYDSFNTESAFTKYLDTIASCGPSSIVIESPDSGTAKPIFWGVDNTWSGAYDSHAVIAVEATYGDGEIIVLGELFNIFIPFYFFELNLYNNRQFIRNLFTTNERADSVWLTATDSTFTIYLPGSTPFVAGSTYFSFNSPTYGLWLRHACDWSYWHTDSNITIQYPDTCPMGETFEVCVKLVPDATGETVLPTGEVCDSFTFNYAAISENPLPGEFSISVRPNPFNSSCRICAPSGSKIEIFDINGRLVYEMPVGARHISPVVWSPEKTIGSGIYLIRIKNGGMIYKKPVVYIK